MRLALACSFLLASTAAFAQAPTDIADLVGTRGSSGEMELEARGYDYVRGNLWFNARTKACVRIRTSEGRYASIDTVGVSACASKEAAHQSANAPKAGFDCTKASSETEKTICASPSLSELDGEMTRLYQLAAGAMKKDPAQLKTFKAEQRGILKGRDDCWKAENRAECIRDVTAFQIDELRTGHFEARSDDKNGISSGPLVIECPGLGYLIGVSFTGKAEKLAVLSWLDQKVVLSNTAASAKDYRGNLYGKPYSASIAGDKVILNIPDEAKPRQCSLSEGG